MNNVENSTNKRILDATESIIVMKGVEKTSLSDIAKEVGISKGTLYYYYSSKNQLIEEIADRYFAQMTKQILDGIQNLNKDEYNINTLSEVLSNIADYKTSCRLHLYLIEEALTRNEVLKEKFKEKYNQWRIIIKRELEKLLKRDDVDYETLSFIIVAVIDGLVLESLLGMNEKNMGGISKFIVARLKNEVKYNEKNKTKMNTLEE